MCNKEAKKPKGSGRRSTKGKQRPAYKRRVKPPYSYVELITMAIKSSPTQMKTLREILDYMQTKFQCFRGTYVGWKNSVRHNLSAAECFVKILRNEQRPYGKDNYWTMNAECSHCFNNANGRLGQHKRKASAVSCSDTNLAPRFIPSSSPAPISPSSPDYTYDASYAEGTAVHDWVANQTLSPRIARVPSSSSDSQSTVQYIELRHTNRVPPNPQDLDFSQFDFSSSVRRVSCMYQVPSSEKPHIHSSHCPRAPSSSSVAESLATHSSGFESSSEAFDLETVNDNLDMIMDDLFVPEDDIDLSLYEDWSGGMQMTPDVKMEPNIEKSYNADSPCISQASTSQPLSPFSTSSVSSEIRTSITPQPQLPHTIKQEFPPSPNWQCYTTHPNPEGVLHASRLQSHQQHHHLPGAHFQAQYNSSTKQTSVLSHDTFPRSSSPVTNGSTSSLHSPKILPTFESMLTSAVRDSLSLDFESVAENLWQRLPSTN